MNRGRGFSLKMVLKDVLFALALALTTYDALQNSPPKVSRTPIPVPFFSRNSVVTDWYKGQLTTAMAKVLSSEVSFTMYYAPWDAESQHVRYEFEKVARVMFKQVHFCALNCWNPTGECRLVNNKISVWPILLVYISAPKKVVVYTGPKDAPSMIRFLRKTIQPITRVHSVEELYKLVAMCDAVAVGFVPFSNGPLSYNIFYNAALKSLQTYPHDDTCFAVVTSETLTSEMGVLYVPHMKLIKWNETEEFPNEFVFNEENIVNWNYMSMQKKTTWYTPRWRKSFHLKNTFMENPVLLLFTPYNHYNERIPVYDLLREVSLEYYNDENPRITQITSLLQNERRVYMENEKIKSIECKSLLGEKIPQTVIIQPVQTSTVSRPSKTVWMNKTICKNDAELLKLKLTLDRKSQFYLTLGKTPEMLSFSGYCQKGEENACYHSDNNDEIITKPPVFIKETEPVIQKTSMLQTQDDPLDPSNLMKRFNRESCVFRKLANQLHHQVFPEVDSTKFNITGLSNKTNETLMFVAVDSLNNFHLAESLGIDILNLKDRTAAIILDNKREAQYLLEGDVGEKSLRQFVFNYTRSRLNRHLRSKVNGSTSSSKRGTKLEKPKNFNNFTDLCQTKSNKTEVCLYELNTSLFKPFISQRKAILVAFCSQGSGACGGLLTLSLMSAAHLLKGLGNKFQVGRIDASINDLPWQYTVSKYPTLVFFPIEHKYESRSYPENQPITVEGVLAFVIAGLEPPLKVHAQLLLCNQTQGEYKMKQCLMQVRYNIANLISYTLKSWRRASGSRAKGILLRRINLLRNLAIHMGALNTTKLPPTHPVLVSIMQDLKLLENLWSSKLYTDLIKDSNTVNIL